MFSLPILHVYWPYKSVIISFISIFTVAVCSYTKCTWTSATHFLEVCGPGGCQQPHTFMYNVKVLANGACSPKAIMLVKRNLSRKQFRSRGQFLWLGIKLVISIALRKWFSHVCASFNWYIQSTCTNGGSPSAMQLAHVVVFHPATGANTALAHVVVVCVVL